MNVLPNIPNPPPVIRLETISELCKQRRSRILEDVDNGKLLWSFNISSLKSQRQDVRVLTASFRAYVENTPCPIKTLDSAIASIFPTESLAPGVATVSGVTLQKKLVMSANHIRDLVQSGELKLAPGKTGNKKSPKVTFHSVKQWLSRRCLGTANYLPAPGNSHARTLLASGSARLGQTNGKPAPRSMPSLITSRQAQPRNDGRGTQAK